MILKHITTYTSHQQPSTTSITKTNPPNSCETIDKSPNISPTKLQAQMTHPQFQKFKVDWNVYKKSHKCEEGGAHLRISFWYLSMNLKNK